jgi:hypothetical protein
MEKLAYLLWDEADGRADAPDRFRDRLLSDLPNALACQATSQLRISATDSAVDAGARLHLGPLAPRALVSFWLECVVDRAGCEESIANACSSMAGFLVCESQPLRARNHSGEPGSRTDGFSLVGCIQPAAGVTHAAFIDRWENVHRDVAIETQSTHCYIRNEIVRPLTPNAPAWGGIVEEGFPLAALTDPHAFYDAVGDEAKFRANSKRMVESCTSFLALDRVDSHPMSEYRFF